MKGLAVALAITLGGCGPLPTPSRLDRAEIRAMSSFDYGDWAATLVEHVDAQGRADYTALQKDRGRLDRFVALLAIVGPARRPSLFETDAHRLAYYINAYNALTMVNVLDRYPIESVRDVKNDFFYFTRFRLDGQEISLYELENEILRKRFGDPRVHFALSCASRGCPVLPREPFVPNKLDAQLDRETKKFLAVRENVAVEGGRPVLSQIFEWYAEDFRPNPVAWIRAQGVPLDVAAGTATRFRPYDWSLNDRR